MTPPLKELVRLDLRLLRDWSDQSAGPPSQSTAAAPPQCGGGPNRDKPRIASTLATTDLIHAWTPAQSDPPGAASSPEANQERSPVDYSTSQGRSLGHGDDQGLAFGPGSSVTPEVDLKLVSALLSRASREVISTSRREG